MAYCYSFIHLIPAIKNSMTIFSAQLKSDGTGFCLLWAVASISLISSCSIFALTHANELSLCLLIIHTTAFTFGVHLYLLKMAQRLSKTLILLGKSFLRRFHWTQYDSHSSLCTLKLKKKKKRILLLAHFILEIFTQFLLLNPLLA